MSKVPVTGLKLDTPVPVEPVAPVQPAPDDSAASVESDAKTVVGRAKSE